MKNIALQRIQEMKSYNPPLSGRRAFSGILLDFNERTIPPSSKVQKAIQGLLKSNKLQLYPEYGDLEKKLAQYVGVNKDKIMITNGSDQGIDLIFRTFTDAGDTVIIPTPSFAMFAQSAQIVGNKILRPLYAKDNLSFRLDELLRMIDGSVKLIVICNPNNPTGTSVAIDGIGIIAQKASNAIILVDEAYFEFSNLTVVPFIKKYPNIIVVRTLSKAFGLPSLRVGYIIASEVYINELLKVRGPYDVNMIAYTAALAALDDLKSAQKYVDEIMIKAKPMVEEFFTKNGVTFYQSPSNFLLYRPLLKQEEEILKKNGILVRSQDKTNIENTLRLTIGTAKQMKRFIKVYQNVILNKSESKKYAFIDRDGTLIFEPQDTFQIDSIEKLKILDGVIKGLKELNMQGYELIMISNQDGLGTSSFPQANFDVPQNKMLRVFEENDITFRKIFICPHLPAKNCGCRKPKTGLVKQFLREGQIDKNNSFVCGDRTTDKLFAKNAGLKFISMQTNGDFYKALIQGGVIV
ncbi:histidinol-phosphate transaminase [Candidatus Gottesmanbacteria bacterium]|nr:histidinol-phosphate transaminase [Candidatus Gottesmanbacteria bacterium]